MPAAEPLAAKAAAETIDRSVMASAEAPATAAGTRLLVRMSLPHRGEPDQPINDIFIVDAEKRRKVLANAGGAVPQLTEWQGTVLLEVRVAVEVGDDTPFHEVKQGRRFAENETQAGRRPKAEGAVVELVEEGGNSPSRLLNDWNAFGEALWY
jgi:hypothetical protein